MKLSLTEVKDLINKVLMIYGYNQKEREKISEVLFYATLRDSSQGLPKLFGWHIQRNKNAEEPEIIFSTKNILRVNAKKNNHMYACRIAVEQLIKVVKKYGVAIAGIFNTDNSSGILSFYTRRFAEQGFVGIMFSSADPVGGITPKGGTNGVFGSNPLSVSLPYNKNPIVLDMSTAKYTWGDLVKADSQNEKLSEGFAYDKNGNITTDPEKVMDDGMVTPFDGSYKGLGLAFVLQVLAGGLVGALYTQDENCGYGSLMIAIDPEKLGGSIFLSNQIKALVKAYKKEGGYQIFLPGERGDKIMQKHLKEKYIEVDDGLYKKIVGIINNN